MKYLSWGIFAVLAICVGLYPFAYLVFDMSHGLLNTKPDSLLQNQIWQTAFYLHIYFGAISLLVGWTQFSKRIRNRMLPTHRLLGKIYMVAVIISGISGLYIAFYATGGIIAQTGFSGLALTWLFTTLRAYGAIRNKEITKHQQWMMRSYAVTFAAVTLRIWLPISQAVMQMDFITAYQIIAWWCWVPNVMLIELYIRLLNRTGQPTV